jgi:tRNA(adenine34) deaminase
LTVNDSANLTQADEEWIRHAMSLAERAEAEGEVPVGAVIVHDGKAIGEGWNRTITLSDPAAHAEMIALREAGRFMANYRLPGCTLYVTLEPCCMCAGAIIHARLDRVVYGAQDPKTGAAGGRFQVLCDPRHNHNPVVTSGCLADDCGLQLRRFFRRRREQQAADKTEAKKTTGDQS